MPVKDPPLSQEEPSARFFATANLVKLLVVLVSGLFIYGYRLGNSPLDRTEPFRALVADQMVHGGSWLVPRLYGEVYLRKPPLIYWIQAAVQIIAGRGNEFVWRLPSVVGSASLAVFLAWWARRWFGRGALFPTGFACLALVALWDQNRGADIDALNTVAAVISTVCVLELAIGTSEMRVAWTISLSLALGSALLLKGPGALPQVLAAMLGPAIFLRNWRLIRRASIALGIVGGFAIFLAYLVAAKHAMTQAGITPDHTGWYEVIEKIFLHGWVRRLKAFLTPISLLVFALPVSVVLPFAVIQIRKLPPSDAGRSRSIAILGTLTTACIIWLLDGNDNPRYEYVMLPLLAPLVGFIWSRWDRESRVFHQTLLGIAALIWAAHAVISLKLSQEDHSLLISIIALAASGACLFWIVRLSKRSNANAPPSAGALLVIMLMLLAVPMGERKNAERRRKSAANASMQLRAIIGDAPRVSAAGLVRDLPELFYYANVAVDSYGEFGLPKLAAMRGGHWVVISENEAYPAYSTIKKSIPGAFPKGVYKLRMPDPRDKIYVGWYDPPADTSTQIEWHVSRQLESEE